VTADAGADGALFDVPELAVNPAAVGRVEAGLAAALRAAESAGTIVAEDAGLIGAALVAARALDTAERSAKPAYAVAALLTPYRECLHALRLPAQVAPAGAARPPAAAEGQGDEPQWFRDAFGTPST
jgi:hypothetical protein